MRPLEEIRYRRRFVPVSQSPRIHRFRAFAAARPSKAPAKRQDTLDRILAETLTGELNFELLTFTPELAKRALSHNNQNRNKSHHTISAYARDMANGDWVTTGDPIRFDSKGNLIDGQHRLEAVVESGLKIPFLVVYGLDTRARHALDIGRKRSPADVLGLMGYHRTTRLAAAARSVNALRSGQRGQRTTAAEIRHIIENHPELAHSTEQFDKAVGISPSMLAAMHYVVGSPKLLNDPETAANILNTFQHGGQKYPGDPLHMFRERVIRDVTQSRRPSPRRMFYGLIRAINGHRLRAGCSSAWSSAQRGLSPYRFSALEPVSPARIKTSHR
jgi:hypothetical protein